MNCSKCPHLAQITQALAPCQTCEAGRIGHTVHITDTNERKLANKLTAKQPDEPQAESVSNLPPEVEDRLRVELATLFSLPPVDFLLVQHIFNSRPLSDFGATMDQLVMQIKRYHGSVKAMAHAKRKSIERIMPKLTKVFKGVRK